MRRLLLFTLFVLLALPAQAQEVDVTFRFVPDLAGVDPDLVVRAFTPGSFNDWGQPYVNGSRIQPGDESEMMRVDDTFVYTVGLDVGATVTYKIQYHTNSDGSDGFFWISDPLNPLVTGPNSDSVVEVADPMAFQLARETNADGEIVAVSAGLFGTADFTDITFEVNGEEQDGLPFYDADTGIFRAVLDAPVPAGSQFGITATDAQGRTVSDQVGIVPGDVVDAPRPAGVEDGITYYDDGSARVTLSLFAPNASFVHVIGDFNDWTIDDDYLLMRDVTAGEDSVRWWITLDDLTLGQEYGFQYVVDGGTRIADFFSEKVLDANNDPFIPASVYPDLMPYPSGETSGPVTVIQPGQPAYDWQVDDFERPEVSSLVIYELLVRDFLSAHSYEALADTLDYLDRLGVNAIELMPISEFGGNLNWGYQPQFYFAPDKYYGTEDALKGFIDAAHQRGIAVILDVVYNHVDLPNPLLELFGTSDANPFVNIPAQHPFNVFFDLNHENPYTQYWLDRVNRYWLEEFRVDGFRFDLSKGFTQRESGGNVGLWSSYDPSRIALIERMADAAWAVDEDAYLILEHFGDGREERELAVYGTDEGRPGLLLWNNQNHVFNEATMGYSADLSGVYYGEGGRGLSVPNYVSYMESHDEQWLMFKNLSFGACERSPGGGAACDPSRPENAGTYNVRRLPVALDRLKQAGAFFFLVPGPKMMWQFGELGYGYGERGEECLENDGSSDCPSFAPGRTGTKPIRWDYYADVAPDPNGFGAFALPKADAAERTLRTKLYKTWSALINLRMDEEVFTSPDTEVDLDVRGPVKRIRLTHPTMNAYILGNFAVTTSDAVAFDFQSEGIWYEYFTGEARDSAQDDAVQLLPGEFRVYTSRQLPPPEDDLITVDVEEGDDLPRAFALEAAYPNPFNPQTTLTFTLDATGPVTLAVYDVLGREVARLVDGPLPAGAHTATFEASGLPSGVYLVRLRAAGRMATQTVTLVK